MITSEQKFILDVIRNNDYVKRPIDYKVLMNELMRHRLFLALYSQVEPYLPEIYKKIYYLNRQKLLNVKKAQLDFFKKIIAELNNTGINYIVLKGFANENKLYGNYESRMFGDLDIFVRMEDFEKIINGILKVFPDAKVEYNCDYYYHETLVRINYDGHEYMLEIKRRHRGCPYADNAYFFSNITYERISVGDLMYPVLNEEALFISFVIYIYNYFSRKSAYILSRKNRLCYFYDFYKLCKIIEYKEHFKKHQNKYEHELKTVFHWLKIVFNDNSFAFADKPKDEMHFEIIDRIFNSDMIGDVYEKFYFDLAEHASALKNNFKLSSNDYSIKGKVRAHGEQLYIAFNTDCFCNDGNEFVYLYLHGRNVYGEPLYPFLPVSIRFCQNDIRIFNRFTIDHSKGIFRRNCEADMPYHKPNTFAYSLSDDKIEISIDLSKLNVNHLTGETYGYNIELIKIIDDDNIIVLSRENDNIEQLNFIRNEKA